MIKKTLLLPFLLYPPAPYAATSTVNKDNLVEIKQRYNIQTGIRAGDQLIDNMLPVGSQGEGYQIYKDLHNLYKGKPSYRFTMQDNQKTRVELSALFVTDKDIAALSPKQVEELINAKSLYHYGQGKSTRNGDTWVYKYGLLLPKETNSQSQGIISQWHGIPDRTSVLSPDGKITNYSLSEFNSSILTKMYFKKDKGIDIGTGKANGYFVDQGGYPPVALKIADGYLYVSIRSDSKRISDKTDRVNLKPADSGPKQSRKQSKTVSIPYTFPLAEIPKEQWLDLKWEITWSEFYPGNENNHKGEKATEGTVKLWIDNKQVLNWQGIVGNNDYYPPYFKYGIYKAGEHGLTIQLAGFEQYKLTR